MPQRQIAQRISERTSHRKQTQEGQGLSHLVLLGNGTLQDGEDHWIASNSTSKIKGVNGPI